MKKKIFNVIWEERWSVNVSANSEEEAEQMILDGEYEESDCSSEISEAPTAYKFNLK